MKFACILFTILGLVGNAYCNCGEKFNDCVLDMLKDEAGMSLISEILMNNGNMPEPVENYRETFCGLSQTAMSCAAADGDACYDEALVLMNEPSDPSTVITGSDGKSLHAVDDCL